MNLKVLVCCCGIGMGKGLPCRRRSKSKTTGSYTCPNKSCNKIFKSKGSYFNHVNYECGGRKQFECWLCHKKFSQKGSLKSHLGLQSEYRSQSNVSIPYKFICPNCCRRYSHKPRLVHHLKHECGYKRFICNICYRTFGRKDHLKNHVICVHKVIANT
ncbi:putative uncharacterized zinc finger protein 814 [Myzus persicae]|uniref:putative uncharacterized zinc finger protein 814 n=1 Tax=Myzus persicae TaxID=13164 RepID=UPI000B93246A|nr:putative uncharacterized zinc finger protein 814 [Myzus persicae]